MSIPPNQFRRDHPWTRPSLVNCQRTRLERDSIARQGARL